MYSPSLRFNLLILHFQAILKKKKKEKSKTLASHIFLLHLRLLRPHYLRLHPRPALSTRLPSRNDENAVQVIHNFSQTVVFLLPTFFTLTTSMIIMHTNDILKHQRSHQLVALFENSTNDVCRKRRTILASLSLEQVKRLLKLEGGSRR